MSNVLRSQKLAQEAFTRIAKQRSVSKDYLSFAKRFPALLHTCGLAQAVSFALAKKEKEYVEDLASVLKASGHSEMIDGSSLDRWARTSPLGGYLRLCRDAICAASWLKRYAEAAAEEGN